MKSDKRFNKQIDVTEDMVLDIFLNGVEAKYADQAKKSKSVQDIKVILNIWEKYRNKFL